MAKWTDKSYAANQARLNNSFMGLNPAYQSTVQEETDRIRRAELNRNRRIALRDDSALRQAEPQKTVVLDPSLASMRLEAEGINPADYGLASTDQAPNEAVIEETGPNGPVGQAARPDDGMTGRFLLRRALEASRKPIDMQRFEQLAQDRQRAGDLSTLTSLYAGEAGPRYSGYQEGYLKKALGEQGAQQLGDYGIASGGAFYETPGIQQGREQETDMAGAELLFDAENDRLARDQAERRLELSEMGYDPSYATKSQRNKNSDFLNKRKTKAEDAQRALGQIGAMREALGTADQGIFAPISNAINSGFAEFKFAKGARQKTIAANVAQAIANAFGIDKLSQIGGNDTERELAVAISTAFQMTNQEEANKYLLDKLEESMTKSVLRSQFADQWSAKFTTVNNVNPLTGESYIVAEEKFLQEQTPKRLGREIEGTSIFRLFDDNQENPPPGAVGQENPPPGAVQRM